MNSIDTARFDDLDTEKIRQQVTVRPDAIRDLGSMDLPVATEVLHCALKKIFLPNDFTLAFIKEMYVKAAMHSQYLFSSQAEYVSRFYSPPDVEIAPICLTGLAGVGKSQTISALRKVLPSPSDFACDHFQGNLRLTSHWYASARGKASGRQLLADFIGAAGGNATKLLQECRRRANRDGVSLLLLEEMQHINTGQGAARVTEILLTMAALGPPMVFVSNYSLLHKLQARHSEDKQRLLSEPRIMLPDDPNSATWNNYIAECFRVAGGCLKGSIEEFSQEIYRSTFGIKRLVVQLLKQAYVEARVAGRDCLAVADISKAYKGVAYAANKEDVEELNLQAIQSKGASRRLDLRCPFELPVALKSNVVAFAHNDRANRVIETVLQSALTEGERAALKESKAGSTEAVRPKSTRAPRTAKLSKDDLARSFHKSADSVLPPSKPGKPR